MKKLLAIFPYFLCMGLFAQEGSVGIGTQTPNQKAVLHLVAPSNDQGFLVPKLTTAQKTTFGNGLTANENGMMIYDTDLNQFFYWQVDHWEAVGSTLQAGTGIDITNGTITNTGDTDATDDFSGDWADLANVPVDFSDGTDDVDDADPDPTNELQDLNLTSNILTISGLATPTQINLASYTGTNTDEQDLQFISGQISLTGDPDNTMIDLSNYDSDVTDDFSGNWSDIAGIPSDFADGTDAVDDADNDPTNEIELPATATTGDVLKFNGTSWVADIDNTSDSDNDPANELQDLNLTSNILTITGLGSPTQIDLAPFSGTNTDEQDLQFNSGIISLSGDPDNTSIDLSPYLDNTDLLADVTALQDQILAFDGANWVATDFLVDDADADPTNEIEFPTDANLGDVMKYDDSGNWSPAPDQVNDADASITNEIQDLVIASNILKITNNATATSINLAGYLDDTNFWESTNDADGNKVVEYQDGHYVKGGNFLSTPIPGDDSQISGGVLDISSYKFARNILFTPDPGKGSTIAEIKTNGISGQELIFVNVGTTSITFQSTPSNSNLYIPATSINLNPGGSIHFMFVNNGKGFKHWITLSVTNNMAPQGG